MSGGRYFLFFLELFQVRLSECTVRTAIWNESSLCLRDLSAQSNVGQIFLCGKSVYFDNVFALETAAGVHG